MSATPRICIIGAGAAGLRCASLLLERGARVTVLEARGRVGGRVSRLSLSFHSTDGSVLWQRGNTVSKCLTV